MLVWMVGCSKSDQWAKLEQQRLERAKVMRPWLDEVDRHEQEAKEIGRYHMQSYQGNLYMLDSATGLLLRFDGIAEAWQAVAVPPDPIPPRPDRTNQFKTTPAVQ
jgi:hypothetical protein